MKARHWFGDAGLAVLLALPTATLANPAAIWQSRPTAAVASANAPLAPALASRWDFNR
jgi:hypothetical protein